MPSRRRDGRASSLRIAILAAANGVVAIYVWDGTWSYQDKLEADAYGTTGSVYQGYNAFTTGSVCVFTRSGTTWSEQARIVPFAAGDSDYYTHGLVLTYGRCSSPGTWDGLTTVSSSGDRAIIGPASINFDGSLAIHNGRIVVGASLYDGPAEMNTGALYVYSRTGVGADWTQ